MTFAIVASGPSLAAWQVEYLRGKAKVIACNGSFQAMTYPAIVYGCDESFWKHYAAAVKAAGHECWTQHAKAARKYGLNWIKSVDKPGLPDTPDMLHFGGNSGYQAICLAVCMGAERIILIGFDMQETGGRWHWHDDLRGVEGKDPIIARWAKAFPPLADGLRQRGIETINCTIETALNCFPRADLRNVL
jgi:Protein of unknown function DUF115